MTDHKDAATLMHDRSVVDRATEIGLRLREPVPTGLLEVRLDESRLVQRLSSHGRSMLAIRADDEARV
jgi:hypothetical protein